MMKWKMSYLVYVVPIAVSVLITIISCLAASSGFSQFLIFVSVILSSIVYSIWFVVQSLLLRPFRPRSIIIMLAVNVLSVLGCCIPFIISYTWEEFMNGDPFLILSAMLILSMGITGIGGVVVWIYKKIFDRT